MSGQQLAKGQKVEPPFIPFYSEDYDRWVFCDNGGNLFGAEGEYLDRAAAAKAAREILAMAKQKGARV